MNLFEVFRDTQLEKQKDRIYGVTIAVVTNNDDPEKLGRVKVKFPWLLDESESTWARVAVLMAGNKRGTWFPPQIDDEVLVAFEHGDINRPIILGVMWNGKDTPPPGSNINSIQIMDKYGNSIALTDKKITIDAGSRDVEIKGKNITIAATGTNTIKGQLVDINP